MHASIVSATVHWDHPRIRGTNLRLQKHGLCYLGSSPHTRDKSCLYVAFRLMHRIIPAYAGQIRYVILKGERLGDHPRIRGTNQMAEEARKNNEGSSPHTRDKSYKLHQPLCASGIIPAYAGQIIRCCNQPCCSQDHPRIRGTNAKGGKPWLPASGSSPHTRDKLYGAAINPAVHRIIPAYAGQIPQGYLFSGGFQDHPRIRGTNLW